MRKDLLNKNIQKSDDFANYQSIQIAMELMLGHLALESMEREAWYSWKTSTEKDYVKVGPNKPS